MILRTDDRLLDAPSKPDAAPPATDPRPDFDARLTRILSAAAAVIARVGYERATMRLVAQSAGVSLAGIYHYFTSKEKMLFLIQFRTFNSLLNNLAEKLHHVDDPVEQLRIMVRSHVGYFVSNLAALKVCSHELDSLSGDAFAEIRVIRRRYYDATRAIVDRIFDQYALDTPLDRHVATMTLFSMLNWLYRWYDPRRHRSAVQLSNQISAQFLFGLIGLPVRRDAAELAEK